MHADSAAAGAHTPRPEQTFFPEPHDRQFALERELAERGVLGVARLDAEPAAAAAAMTADRDALVEHLASSVLGVQASKGMAA